MAGWFVGAMVMLAGPAAAQDSAYVSKDAKRVKQAKPKAPKPRAKPKSKAKPKPNVQVITLLDTCGPSPRREPLTAAVELAREQFDAWSVPYRGLLGVGVRRVRARERKQLGAPPNAGLRVTRVTPGSVAEAAGVKVGDVIIDVGGKTTARPSDVRRALRHKDEGDLLTVQVVRHRKPRTLAATLPASHRNERAKGRLHFDGDPPVPRVGVRLQRIKQRIRALRIRRALVRRGSAPLPVEP